MKKIYLLGLLISSLFLNGQTYDSTAIHFANTITVEELSKHLHIIASDEFEGRETGRKGQKMTMKYLIDQFKNVGIEPIEGTNYIQSFPLVEQKSEGIELSFDQKKYKVNKDFIFSPSIYEKKSIETELVFIGYGIEEKEYNNYENIDIKGKAVFIWNEKVKEEKEFEREWTIKERIDLAKSKGATAIFYYDDNLDEQLKKYEHYFKKSKMALANSTAEEIEIPLVRMNKSLTEDLLKKGKLKLKKLEKNGFKRKDRFTVDIELNINKPTNQLSGENVLAFIEGSEKKEELIILTAHYDHLGKNDSLVFNGADDDGSGTVALIEIAEAFKKAADEGFRPKRSILIMPVSGEEKGLLGSKYYSENPVFPLENTVANLNVDMIGRYDHAHKDDSNYVYLIGSDRLSDDLHELSEKVNELYTGIKLDYTFNEEDDPNRFYYRSDHYNFAKHNVPVIFYFSGVHQDYHRHTDTVEKIDFEKTARITRLIFLTAWHLANQEERIQLNKEVE